jgi:hypothetical protein
MRLFSLLFQLSVSVGSSFRVHRSSFIIYFASFLFYRWFCTACSVVEGVTNGGTIVHSNPSLGVEESGSLGIEKERKGGKGEVGKEE